MKRLLLLTLLFLPLSLSAQDLVEFQNGQVADADDINANFSSLEEAIDSLPLDSDANFNTSAGSLALNSNTTGNSNTAMGHAALA